MSKDQTVSVCCTVPNTGKIADMLYKDKAKRRNNHACISGILDLCFLLSLTIPSNSTG